MTMFLSGCASRSAGPTAPGQGVGQDFAGTPAPNFTLTDQFGERKTLSAFRGRPVLLSFIDSHCTTVCPLTAQLMTRTEQLLGPDHPIQLLAVNANPRFSSVSDVRRWSAMHGLLHRWLFLTGKVERLRAIWSHYGIQVEMLDQDVAHTALVFLIDAGGSVRATFPIAQNGGVDREARSIARVAEQVSADTM